MSLTEKIKDSVDSLRSEVRELRDQIAGLVSRKSREDQALAPAPNETESVARWVWPGWPHVDVRETDRALKVSVDLPGLQRDDVEIHVEQNRLILSASHSTDRHVEDEGWVRRERVSGRFVRTLRLPAPVAPDDCAATMNDGVLRLELSKLDSGRSSRRIQVA